MQNFDQLLWSIFHTVVISYLSIWIDSELVCMDSSCNYVCNQFNQCLFSIVYYLLGALCIHEFYNQIILIHLLSVFFVAAIVAMFSPIHSLNQMIEV